MHPHPPEDQGENSPLPPIGKCSRVGRANRNEPDLTEEVLRARQTRGSGRWYGPTSKRNAVGAG